MRYFPVNVIANVPSQLQGRKSPLDRPNCSRAGGLNPGAEVGGFLSAPRELTSVGPFEIQSHVDTQRLIPLCPVLVRAHLPVQTEHFQNAGKVCASA